MKNKQKPNYERTTKKINFNLMTTTTTEAEAEAGAEQQQFNQITNHGSRSPVPPVPPSARPVPLCDPPQKKKMQRVQQKSFKMQIKRNCVKCSG